MPEVNFEVRKGLTVPRGTAAAPSVVFDPTDFNTGLYSPGADQLALATNGAQRFAIDSSGRILVGTSSAIANTTLYGTAITSLAQVHSTGSTPLSVTTWAASNATSGGVVLSKSRGAPVGTRAIVVNGDDLGNITFTGDDGTNFVPAAAILCEADGVVSANVMPGRLVFFTTADGASTPTERLRITSTGQVRLAGAGITFNGDTATANELDDYEEGTFTPTVFGTTVAGTGTYTTQVGWYTKIGNRVCYTLRVAWSAHTGTGNIRVGSLPFTSSSQANSFASTSVSPVAVTLTANNTISVYTLVNATTIELAQYPVGGGSSTQVPMFTAGDLVINGIYFV